MTVLPSRSNILAFCGTLKFLSIEGLYKSMGFDKRNSSFPQFTDHCFTGDYPVRPLDAEKIDSSDQQLSYLSSKRWQFQE